MNRVARAHSRLRHPLARPVALGCALLALALAAAPVFARTSSLPVDSACLEADCAEAGSDPAEAQKATGTDKRAVPSATRPSKPVNTRANGARKPRWHRFLPGMYR